MPSKQKNGSKKLWLDTMSAGILGGSGKVLGKKRGIWKRGSLKVRDEG